MLEKHFQYWAALTLFSLINLTSLTNHFILDQEDWSTKQRWVISAASISFIMSVIACLFHIVMKDTFPGKTSELGMVVVVLAMWCASLPYLMDGDHRFAVLEGDFAGISNGNIFFSSWGALIFSLLLATSHFEIYYDRADEDKHLYHWVGFTTASLVVMCSTARYFNRVCSDVELEDEPTCSRAAFGLVLGAISTVVGISITWVDITLVYTQMTSVIFLVAWCFAAAYLTFDEGPGVAIGTLYFATWFGLLFILFIAASAILEMFHKILDSAPAEETPPVEGDAAVSKDNEVVDTKMGDEEVEEEEVAETA